MRSSGFRAGGRISPALNPVANCRVRFGWKVSSGEISWSDETFRIFQCDPHTKPTLEFALTRVHPKDRELLQQQIERASRDGKAFDF